MNNKTKRWALVSLCALMVLSCAFAIVGGFKNSRVTAQEIQPNTVAVVDTAQYESFDEALAQASQATGSVVVEIYGKVTLKTALTGSYSSITFVGKDADAEIYLDVQGYITASGKNVNFSDLTLSKSAGGFIGNAGWMNTAFGIYEVVNVNYTNCVFANGACASFGNVKYTNCTFHGAHGTPYGLWAYGNVDVTVSGCTFVGERAIKMYDEGHAGTAALTVENTDFSGLNKKPAIVLTYGKSVTLSGNTYSSTGTLELDLDGAPNGTPIVSSDPITCVNDNGECGVIVDGKIYTTVAQAAAVATSGSVVTLLHNTDESVVLPAGAKLDTNGYTASNVEGEAVNAVARVGFAYYNDLVSALQAIDNEGGTLTLMKDVTITTAWDNRYTGAKTTAPVVIDGNGHTLKFTGTISDGYNYLSVFRFESDATVKNLTMDLSEAISGWGSRLRAISSQKGLIVDNCTFIGNPAYGNTNAIIFGETNDTTITHTASITNCTFKNWKNGVSDNQNGRDTATTLTIANNDFENANVNVSASEKVVFTGNNMNQSWVGVKSYGHTETLEVTFTNNQLTANTAEKSNFVIAEAQNVTSDDASVLPVVNMGGKYYLSVEAFVADVLDTATATISLTGDVTASAAIVIDTGLGNVTFKANGFTVNGNIETIDNVVFADELNVVGNIVTEGEVMFNKTTVVSGYIDSYAPATFAGATTVTMFYANSDNTVNVTPTGSLKITSGSRITIGYNSTFNIEGNITDAKNTDTTGLTPSLHVAGGASITGGRGATFNVKNAYVKFDAYCSTKNSVANGTFNFNVENSIWQQSNTIVFSEPSSGKDPVVNFNLVDSVLTSTSHLVFAVKKGNIVFDNSNVNVGAAKQLEVRSTLTIKNGSVVYASDNTNENARKPGTVIVENATYVGTGTYSGSNLGIGNLILRSGANVTLGTIEKTNLYQYPGSNLTATKVEGTTNVYEMQDYTLNLNVSDTTIQANDTITVEVSFDKAFYSAEYTFAYDTTKFACADDTDGDGYIYVYAFEQDANAVLATYTLIAKNDITKVTNTEISASGNAVQFKEQAISNIVNNVTDAQVTITISLDYTYEIHADYVTGYTLVLVRSGNSEDAV